jgi:hypothetical protein
MDMEFATEIGQNLLVEVRRLQALLSERDRALEQAVEERDAWELERENLASAVKTAEATAGEFLLFRLWSVNWLADYDRAPQGRAMGE